MSIRTTVTLDDDVLEKLKRESRSRGISFKETINEVLRSGLLASRSPAARRKFRVQPKRMGTRPGLDYDNVPALLEIGEGDRHR